MANKRALVAHPSRDGMLAVKRGNTYYHENGQYLPDSNDGGIVVFNPNRDIETMPYGQEFLDAQFEMR